MASKKIILIVALFCFCLVKPAAGVEFPLIQSMAYFPFFENKMLPKSDMTLVLKGSYSNIYSYNFNDSESMINDFELASMLMSLRYGLFENTVLEFFGRYFYVSGGVMDKSIEDFHNLFGLPSAGRENFPRNRVNFEYNDHFKYNSSTGSTSPLVFSVLQRFTKTGAFNIYGRFFVGIPFKSKPGFVSDKLFYGTGLVFQFNHNDFSIGLASYVSFFRKPQWLNDADLNNSIFYADLQIRFKRFLGGVILKTSPIKEGNLSHDAHQVYVGYKISDNFEMGFIEDLTKFDTTPDICFYFWVKII